MISGINNIVLTKLDVLDDLDKIKICTGYEINGIKYDYLPFNEILQEKAKPVYENIDGWKESTYGIKNWNDLPLNAKNYVKFLEKIICTDISIISTGPERNQTIDRKDILRNI